LWERSALVFAQIEVDRWLEDIVASDGRVCKGKVTFIGFVIIDTFLFF